LMKKAVLVHLLQRVVKVVVPLIDQHVDVNEPKVQCDDDRQQAACRPAFLRPPERLGQNPQVGEEGLGIVKHSAPLKRVRCYLSIEGDTAVCRASSGSAAGRQACCRGEISNGAKPRTQDPAAIICRRASKITQVCALKEYPGPLAACHRLAWR